MLQRSRIQITFSTMGHEEFAMVVRVFGALLIGGMRDFSMWSSMSLSNSKS